MKTLNYQTYKTLTAFLILNLFVINILTGQNNDLKLIDSLEKWIIKNPKNDSVYIENLIKLELLYVDNRIDKKDTISFDILEKSKEINYYSGVIAGQRLLAYQFAEKGDFVKALEYAHDKLDLCRKVNNIMEEIDSYNLLTFIYATSGNNQKALEYTLIAFEKINNIPTHIKSWYIYYGNIATSLANLYMLENQNEKALDIQNDIIKKMDVAILEKKLNKERAIYFKAVAYTNMSAIYFKEKDYNQSVQNGEKMLELSKVYNFESLNPAILNVLVASYTKLKQISKAENYLELLNEYFKNQKLQIEEVKNYYEACRDLYLEKKDFKEAYYFQDKYFEISDSIRSKEVQNKLNDLTIKYETKEKEQTNQLLKADNEKIQFRNKVYISFLILLILLLTLGAYLFYKLKITNNKLDESNQIKTKLFSIIAHDIKAPVVSMYNFFDMLNYHIQKNNYDKIIELSNDAAIQSNQLNLSVENILRWSMLQQNIYKVNIRSIELNPVIMDVLDEFKFQIKKKNLLINYDNSMELKIVQCDFTILSILFRNIISNAIKFSNENGEIRIFNKDNALIIEDDGIGISKEDIYNIENGIQKIKSQRKNEGSGIGLSLCYDLAKKTNISLVIEQGKSKGTKMIIVFNNTLTPIN